MKYKLLGRSGLRVSELCLGTMTFGEDWGWGSPKEECGKIYAAYRDAGGNFIDTANFYTNGTSESLLGELLSGHRAEVVLATKFTLSGPTKDPNASGNQRKNMVQAVEQSLKRLRTDYIDLYWVHIWDQLTPVDEVMRAFDDLVREGKILYAGVSDYPAWLVARANTIAELRGWTPFVGLQIEYSLLERTPERELLPMAKELGLAITAWSPLAGGLLSGKYKQGAGQGGRLSKPEAQGFFEYPEERVERVVKVLIDTAERLNTSPAQVALAWLRTREQTVIPIVGAKKLDQLNDNLKSIALEIPPELLKNLNSASEIELGFPSAFYAKEHVQGVAYGGMKSLISK